MAKEISQEKVKRMARVMRIVMGVFFWVSVIAVGAGILAYVVLFFVPDQSLVVSAGAKPDFGLSFDGLVRFQMDPGAIMDINLQPFFQAVSVMAAVLMVGLAGIFWALKDILRTVEENRPFAKENSKRLTTIGVIFMIGSVVYNLAQVYVANTIIHTFHLTNIQINMSADLFLLLTGFMMLVLAGVFRYGSFLQDEYDSTL